MNFQAKNRQWKYILIAIAAGIISIFLSAVIMPALGMELEINDPVNWPPRAILVFIVITGIVYAFLLFLFVHKRNGQKGKEKQAVLKKSIYIPVVSITKSANNSKPSVSKISELEKLIRLKKRESFQKNSSGN